MSNLRLINDTSASSVAKVTIDNIFSEDYDIYKIVFSNMVQSSNSATVSNLRFINSSGTEISSSNYNYAKLVIRAGGSFSENRAQDQSSLWHSIYNCVAESDFGGAEMWIFNPFTNGTYTTIINQSFFRYYGTSGGTVGHEGYKSIAAFENTSSCTGISFFNDTGNFTSFACKVYGLRVDV